MTDAHTPKFATGIDLIIYKGLNTYFTGKSNGIGRIAIDGATGKTILIMMTDGRSRTQTKTGLSIIETASKLRSEIPALDEHLKRLDL